MNLFESVLVMARLVVLQWDLVCCLTCRLNRVLRWVLDVLQADEVLKGADLVITGEGQMDNQTLQGKTPYGIAKRASLRGIPTIGIAGSLGTEVEALYGEMNSLFGTVRSPQTLEKVLQEADINLARTARNIAATLRLGHKISQK